MNGITIVARNNLQIAAGFNVHVPDFLFGVAAGGHEDHVVSTMAFMGLEKYPIRLFDIPKLKYNQCTNYWKHEIKMKDLGLERT